MNTDQRPSVLYSLCRRGGMMLFCLLVAAVTGLSATGWADSLFLITGTEGEAAIILDPSQKDPPDLSSQIVYVSNGSRGYDITLQEGTAVTVRHEGSAVTVQSHKESVSSLLSRLHIYPSSLELIGVELSETGVEVNVASTLTYHDYVTATAPFSTQWVANPDMLEGEEKVVQEGAGGMRSSVYKVVWSNGAQLSRQFVEELDTTAVDKIVEYGTAKPKPAEVQKENPDDILAEHGETGGGIASVSENADGSGTLTLKDGTALNYSGVRSMTATAYTTGHDGVGTLTASGTAVHVGSVAVDKSVIPLGTRMYIVAGGNVVYGLAVAEDTGVKGNTIDLYYDTYEECIQFGRRNCTVYILE